MKRILFFSILLCGIIGLHAQTVTVNKSYKVVEDGFHPVLNAEGDMLLYTAENYQGLNLYTFKDETSVHINDEITGGFMPVFSLDNKRVFYKNAVYESRLRNEGIMSYEIANEKKVQLVTPKRNLKPAQAYHNGVVVNADKQLRKATFGKTTKELPRYVWSDGVDLNIFVDGKTQVLNPVEGANGYIWASVSPDESKILFTAPARGTYVCDLEGKILHELGYLNAPVWYGNNLVVGMIDKDDGENITSSKILIRSLDGKLNQVISKDNEIALYPTAAGEAGKVAYCTSKREIVVLELSIK